VIVIASTNRPFDLDEAVLRRLPRRIMVDLPDLATREEILTVSLASNRLAPEVNVTRLAELLEGYTGSDIKEVCREAVVRVAHERAQILEGRRDVIRGSSSSSSNGDQPTSNELPGMAQRLRPVAWKDFLAAMKRLKASIDENGKELSKVLEWNEKYGERKRSASKEKERRKSTLASHYNMYV
jgi:SpoVK/Ycf46/Vps4 family AAA+-type ATPase